MRIAYVSTIAHYVQFTFSYPQTTSHYAMQQQNSRIPHKLTNEKCHEPWPQLRIWLAGLPRMRKCKASGPPKVRQLQLSQLAHQGDNKISRTARLLRSLAAFHLSMHSDSVIFQFKSDGRVRGQHDTTRDKLRESIFTIQGPT